MLQKVYIIIPAKNEDPRIGGVIREIKDAGYNNIIVVNDGSSDDTEFISRAMGVDVISHPINLGAGAATQTGIQYALSLGADIVVTIDADHQHFPSDITNLIDSLNRYAADIAIGSRFLRKDNDIPISRLIYNRIANVITFCLTGLKMTDSQSGLKAMRSGFAKKCKIQSEGFEFCVEIIRNIKIHKASVIEIPIRVRYTAETLNKGQNLLQGIKTLQKLLRQI